MREFKRVHTWVYMGILGALLAGGARAQLFGLRSAELSGSQPPLPLPALEDLEVHGERGSSTWDRLGDLLAEAEAELALALQDNDGLMDEAAAESSGREVVRFRNPEDHEAAVRHAARFRDALTLAREALLDQLVASRRDHADRMIQGAQLARHASWYSSLVQMGLSWSLARVDDELLASDRWRCWPTRHLSEFRVRSETDIPAIEVELDRAQAEFERARGESLRLHRDLLDSLVVDDGIEVEDAHTKRRQVSRQLLQLAFSLIRVRAHETRARGLAHGLEGWRSPATAFPDLWRWRQDVPEAHQVRFDGSRWSFRAFPRGMDLRPGSEFGYASP